MTTQVHDINYQYSYGRDLLSATLIERQQLLHRLGDLAQAPQGMGSAAVITRFDLSEAQLLLYNLLTLGQKIDALIVQINRYAEMSGKPRVEIKDPNLK